MRRRHGIADTMSRLVVLVRQDDGQALAEYGLILALVFTGCVIALAALGLVLAGELSAVGAAFP